MYKKLWFIFKYFLRIIWILQIEGEKRLLSESVLIWLSLRLTGFIDSANISEQTVLNYLWKKL